FPDSTIAWNGSKRTTTYISNTELRMAIAASDVVAAGTMQISVMNPTPGGGVSSPLTLTINNPVPRLESIAPAAVIGGQEGTVILDGQGFEAASEVSIHGQAVHSEYQSPSRLLVTLPAGLLADAGPAEVAVRNDGPGGGTASKMLYVIAAGTPSATTHPL